MILAILFPFLYFFKVKRTGLGFVSLLAFILSIFLAMTIVMAIGSLILWMIFALIAAQDYRKRLMQSHAQMVGEEVAKHLRPSA